MFRKVHKGLVRRYEGPFPVVKKVGKVSYRLQLPAWLKIHPVFHGCSLKPYHEDMEDPARGVSRRAPATMMASFDKDVECILAERMTSRRGVPAYKEYFLKWRGLPEREASWERADELWQFEDQIRRFIEEGSTREEATP